MIYNGLALELSSSKHWYLYGELHREDGPAIEWADGSTTWYLNGKEYSEEEYALIQFMKGVNVYV